MLLLLSACGGGERSPYGGTEKPTAVKIGKPYTVQGIRYVPKYEAFYEATGMASWYGPGFHGRRAASGERFDENAMTAAHTTLPMPSLVRVTNLNNGRSAVVRVNDRGPFTKGRILDLSKAAASELDMIRTGTARVRVQYLADDTESYIADLGLAKPAGWRAPPTQPVPEMQIVRYTRWATEPPVGAMAAPPVEIELPAAAPKDSPFGAGFASQAQSVAAFTPAPDVGDADARYRVQAGSFGSHANATLRAKLLAKIASAEVKAVEIGGKILYRVLLGPVRGFDAARDIIARAKALGVTGARILVE